MDRTYPQIGVMPKGTVFCHTVEALKTHYEGYASNTDACLTATRNLPIKVEPVVITKTARYVLFIVRIRPLLQYAPPMLIVWRQESRGL